MTPQEYEEMLIAQRGLCALCGRPPRDEPLMVDHDHESGEIRGLIHRFCNSLLGFAEEDKEILLAAIEYIERHRGKKFRLLKSNQRE